MNGDISLWYDCDEAVPHKRSLSRIAHGARVVLVLALLAAAYLAWRVLF